MLNKSNVINDIIPGFIKNVHRYGQKACKHRYENYNPVVISV